MFLMQFFMNSKICIISNTFKSGKLFGWLCLFNFWCSSIKCKMKGFQSLQQRQIVKWYDFSLWESCSLHSIENNDSLCFSFFEGYSYVRSKLHSSKLREQWRTKKNLLTFLKTLRNRNFEIYFLIHVYLQRWIFQTQNKWIVISNIFRWSIYKWKDWKNCNVVCQI